MTPDEIAKAVPKEWVRQPDGNNGTMTWRFPGTKQQAMRIDPSDSVTQNWHVHLFDENGNPLDVNGNIVGRTDPAAHMECKLPMDNPAEMMRGFEYPSEGENEGDPEFLPFDPFYIELF